MKDFQSLESKIRKLVDGRLQPGGWEQVSETLWIHPVAEIARLIDTKGEEHYINKDGKAVDVYENNDDKRKAAKLKKAEIRIKIIDEKDRLIRQALNVLNLLPIVRLMEKKKPWKKDDDEKDSEKEQSDKKDKDPVVADKAKDKPGDPSIDSKKEGPKKADGSSDDDKDPKKITGGKTEVDTHPTTDDKLTDDSKEKKDGDKAAKDENKKIGKKGSTVKEEAIDEISKGLAKRYHRKAVYSFHKNDPASTPEGERKVHNRIKGMDQAKAKLSGKAKVKATKEEFTPEQLAYFDAIMAEEYVDMSKKAVDAVINAKGKPHKVYTATDETRHGIGVDELKKHLGVGESDHVHKKFMHNLHTAGVRTGWSHSSGKWIAYHGKKV